MQAQVEQPKYLQTMIGTVADGGIGPKYFKKLDEYLDENGLEETYKIIVPTDKGTMKN